MILLLVIEKIYIELGEFIFDNLLYLLSREKPIGL